MANLVSFILLELIIGFILLYGAIRLTKWLENRVEEPYGIIDFVFSVLTAIIIFFYI